MYRCNTRGHPGDTGRRVLPHTVRSPGGACERLGLALGQKVSLRFRGRPGFGEQYQPLAFPIATSAAFYLSDISSAGRGDTWAGLFC
eukprot:4234096-Prymnesium_polylepis.1